MEERPNNLNQPNDAGLTITEIDTIGEILNISMGAAATAVSILLSRQVIITTPSVQVMRSADFEFSQLEPALGIEIKYIQGLFGSNHMIMSVRDIKAIVRLLLGGDYQELPEDAGLDEIHISALAEVMNQMMGASCTALASFLNREINISPPTPFEISSETIKELWADQQERIVTISFKLTIEGLVDSEFFTVMPVPFARELVHSAIGMSEVEGFEEEPEAPQVIGHTQVPGPMHMDDYPVKPQPAPEAEQTPAPPASKRSRSAKTAAASAPDPKESKPETTPAPAPKEHAPAAAPMPAPQIPMSDAVAMQTAMAAPVPQESRTIPSAAPQSVPAYGAPAWTAPMQTAPVVPPRAVPAGGYVPEKAVPHQNVVVKPLQFGSLDTDETAAEEMDSVNLGLVMGVDLNVTVEIGRTKKQVKEILALRQGSIVELDKQAGAPVDIVVNGKLIARGDVVVIDDNFGVRITEIVNTAAQK